MENCHIISGRSFLMKLRIKFSHNVNIERKTFIQDLVILNLNELSVAFVHQTIQVLASVHRTVQAHITQEPWR